MRRFTVPPPIRRFRWPLAIAGALAVAVSGGMLVGTNTADGMDTFYANVAAADAERLARLQSPPPEEEAPALVDNTMPPVAPVDLSFARATKGATNGNEGDTGQ